MSWRAAYTRFCTQVPDVPVFMQPWYLDAVCDAGDWAAAVVEEGDRTVAVLPYFMKQKWGFRYTTQPLFTKYLGPYLAEDKRHLVGEFRYYRLLQEQLPELAGHTWEASPQLTNWLPFYYTGFRQTTRYTYCLDLAGAIPIDADFNRNIRRNIRSGDAQLRLRHDLGLDVFWQLNQLSFSRQGIAPPYTFDQLARHVAAVQAHEAGRFFFAVDESGKVHSAAYLLRDRQRAYYHLSGDDPALRQSGSGIWIAYQAMCYARDVWQVPIFDFEGSMLPSVERIRRQFGARQESYFKLWRHDNRLFDLLLRVKR